MTKNTIFVQIASYKDPQLIPTLNDMFSNAVNPDNLRITICWQHGLEQNLEWFTNNGFKLSKSKKEKKLFDEFPIIQLTKGKAKIQLIDVHFHKTKGACWARNAIQQLYNGEKYTLQLDSHHRFAKDWDVTLIDMLESVRTEKTPKPLLTAYVPSYDPENDPGARAQDPWKMDFDRFIPEGAVFFLPATIDNWQTLDKPVPSRFYSAHFCFTDGIFSEEVQHDPEYFFHGEEIAIAARAFTHGYDLFHPHRAVVWHEYTRRGRSKCWDDMTTDQKRKGRVELDWVERNNICHNRNRTLFGMDGQDPKSIDFGKYGFGSIRTLREYEEYAGICFELRSISEEAYRRSPNHHYPPGTVKFENEQQWKDAFMRSIDVRICVHKNELGEDISDVDFCFAGTHDKEGKELYRKDLTADEVRNYARNEWIDYRFVYLGKTKPYSYTLWAHSASKGWLNKVDKVITEAC